MLNSCMGQGRPQVGCGFSRESMEMSLGVSEGSALFVAGHVNFPARRKPKDPVQQATHNMT